MEEFIHEWTVVSEMIVSFALLNSFSNHQGCGCILCKLFFISGFTLLLPIKTVYVSVSQLSKQYELIYLSNLVDDLC